MPSQPTTAGIITDEASGERHIPESKRADGSTRRAIKIRPGYRPPEDVELYKNRTAESFRQRGKSGIPGAEGLKEESKTGNGGAGANKNAKRREARKKAAATATTTSPTGGPEPDAQKTSAASSAPAAPPASAPEDAQTEREKKARGLKKKLKQAKDLKSKRDDGEALLPEQIAKVIRIHELIRELEALGFDAEGEPKGTAASTTVPGDRKT